MTRAPITLLLARREALALVDAGFLPLNHYVAMVAEGAFDSQPAADDASTFDGDQDSSRHRAAATGGPEKSGLPLSFTSSPSAPSDALHKGHALAVASLGAPAGAGAE